MQSSSGNYSMCHQVPMVFLLLLVYLGAAACISGGTKFGRMLAQGHLDGQSSKKRVKNIKNRYIVTVIALVDAIHQSMLSS